MSSLGQARLVFHGAVVLLLSLLCGFPLFLALQQGWSDEAIRFWRSAHLGLSVVGIWSIATGAALGFLVLDERRIAILAWSVIVSNYTISVAILIRAVALHLGIAVLGSPFAQIVALCRNASAATGLVAVLVTVRGGAQAVRAVKRHLAGAASRTSP